MRWFNGSDDYIREYVSCWNRELRKKRITNVLAALVLIAVGVLCVLFPADVYQVVQWIVGGVLILYALFEVVDYFSMTDYFRDMMLLPIALIALMLGIVLFCLMSAVESLPSSFLVVLAWLRNLL